MLCCRLEKNNSFHLFLLYVVVIVLVLFVGVLVVAV